MTLESFFKSFNSTWGALFGLAVTIATAAPFLDLAPPWPDAKRAIAIGIVACIVGISVGYFIPFRSQRSERKAAIVWFTLTLILLLTYFYVSSLRVFEYEQMVDNERVIRRIVVGTELQNPADRNKRTFELIELYGVADTAWTHRSLTNARVCLLASYAVFYFALTFSVGLLQRHSARIASRREPSAQ